MALEIGKGENGFVNGLYAENMEQFLEQLSRYDRMSTGVDMPDGFVPQTIYWLYVNEEPIGYGKLRHRLNEKLLERGGHIGYVIRPSERGKGYGKLLLEQLLRKAKGKNITEVLLTVDEHNVSSRKIIEANDGELTEWKDGICKYWIKLV
ncbi:Acetyltransferase (GNAT) family protein [compost metagenome]